MWCPEVRGQVSLETSNGGGAGKEITWAEEGIGQARWKKY